MQVPVKDDFKKEVFIVIPAYNEEKNIGKVIEDLHKHGYKNIIVVDDGSIDKTYEIAKRKGCMVLRHITNLGQGAALRTGIKYALLKNAKVIVTFDADGQHLAKDIENLVKPIIFDDYDVVLGSRFLKKDSNIPIIRKIVLKLGVLFTRLISGIKVTDTHNGLRALSNYAAKKIKITMNGMTHASEILDEIVRNNLKYKEVPVTILYNDETLKKGQSSLNSIRIAIKMINKKLFGR